MRFAIDHLLSVLVFVLFVLAPIPLGLRVVTLQEEERGRLSIPQALLSVLLVWCILHALIAHVLGVLHLLRFPAMLVAEAALFGIGLIVVWPDLRSLRPVRTPRANQRAIDPSEWVVLLALSFMGLTLLWWSAAMPVINWDSWAFHMPHMADWQLQGRFTRMAQDAYRPRNSYPYGWEALCTLFLTPFGEDVLVTFPNLVAWVIFGLTSYLLARLYRARRIHALACAALVLAIRYQADIVNTLHVDLPLAALVLASAYCGLVGIRSASSVSLGLSIVTGGFACATRTSGPLYAVFLIAWLLMVWRETGFRALPWRGGATLIGFGLGVPLSAFWYVKNVIERGHPLGGQFVRDAAFLKANTLAFSFNPMSVASWTDLYKRSFHELEAPFLALVAMTALWPLARIWMQKRPSEPATTLVALFIGLIGVFSLTPLSSLTTLQMRLGLALFGGLAACAAVGATRARLHPSVPVAFAVLAAARTFSGSRVLYGLMLLAVVWGVWRIRPARPLSRNAGVVAALALFGVFTMLTAAARQRRESERIQYYGTFYSYLAQNVPAQEPVAYLLSLRSYLFYGRSLERQVIYAPLEDGQSVDEWAAALRAQHVRFVLLGTWEGEWRTAIAKRLVAPGSPATLVVGNAEPGEISVLKLTP